MSKVDWSKAPEGAQVYANGGFWLQLENGNWLVHSRALGWAPVNVVFPVDVDTPFFFKDAQRLDEIAEGKEIADFGCGLSLVDDPVNKPKHYAIAPDVEAIDIIRSALTPEQFKGYLLGNFLKYRLRAGDKGDLQQDIDKSNWYKRELNK